MLAVVDYYAFDADIDTSPDAITFACSRRTNFWIFPVDVLGMGMKTILLGTL